VLLARYYSGDQINVDDMGGTCCTWGWGGGEAHLGVWWRNLKEKITWRGSHGWRGHVAGNLLRIKPMME